MTGSDLTDSVMTLTKGNTRVPYFINDWCPNSFIWRVFYSQAKVNDWEHIARNNPFSKNWHSRKKNIKQDTMIKGVLGIFVIAFVIGSQVYRIFDIPPHLLNHKLLVIPDLIPADVCIWRLHIFDLAQTADTLLDLVKEMKEFPTNANDLKFYKTLHEHIGEAQPISDKGVCDHPYLVCVFSLLECADDPGPFTRQNFVCVARKDWRG